MSLDFIKKQYPELQSVLDKISISLPVKSEWPVEKAVLKVICGQMLSRTAANTIFGRLMEVSQNDAIRCMRLPDSVLKGCGLSNQKLKTIRAVLECFEQNDGLSHWVELPYKDLSKEVGAVWGLSQWSVDMLAIFYFAQPDVYPKGDGTIKKVESLLNDKFFSKLKFSSDRASPYKTTLSLAMWKLYDDGLLNH
jgi:DNA-3-methyladenine glycosylase II